MSEIKQEYTGTWIPAAIMLNENIKPIEKLIYAEIASFTVCWASNAWIAKRVGVTERSVTTYVKHLKELQLIVVTETENSRSCIATQNLLPPLENFSTPLENFSIKNNNIDNNKKELHTSTLRDDETVSASLTASSSAGGGNSPIESSAARTAREEHIQKVFNAIVTVTHGGQPILYTATRRNKLVKRLEKFKPSEVVIAAKNLMQSPWHTGDNPNNKKYASFDFLMRNDEMVEKWLNEKPVTKLKSVF